MRSRPSGLYVSTALARRQRGGSAPRLWSAEIVASDGHWVGLHLGSHPVRRTEAASSFNLKAGTARVPRRLEFTGRRRPRRRSLQERRRARRSTRPGPASRRRRSGSRRGRARGPPRRRRCLSIYASRTSSADDGRGGASALDRRLRGVVETIFSREKEEISARPRGTPRHARDPRIARPIVRPAQADVKSQFLVVRRISREPRRFSQVQEVRRVDDHHDLRRV